MKFEAEVDLIKENGWEGKLDHSERWEKESKEELFLEILKRNNRIMKNFSVDAQNKDCWRLKDWNLQEEYDLWWYNLTQEKKEEIFEES